MKAKFKFIGIYQGLIFIPWALSGFLMGLVWKWIFDESFGVLNDALLKLGIIDSRIPWLSDARWGMAAVIIANVWYGVTFFVIMILAALQGVPNEMLEAAELDGANRFQTLFSVIIPYIRATLILIVLLRIMWITNFPDLIFGMTQGGPAGQTHIISSWLIEKLTLDADWGAASALGLMTMVILSICKVIELKPSTVFILRIIAVHASQSYAITNGVLNHATSAVTRTMLQRVIVAAAKKS
jgi:multiple sugar transport system permease protein